jgi:hypothetical protein
LDPSQQQANQLCSSITVLVLDAQLRSSITVLVPE